MMDNWRFLCVDTRPATFGEIEFEYLLIDRQTMVHRYMLPLIIHP